MSRSRTARLVAHVVAMPPRVLLGSLAAGAALMVVGHLGGSTPPVPVAPMPVLVATPAPVPSAGPVRALSLDSGVSTSDETVEPLAGDDNGDGQIMEDESGFDCRYDGNQVCGRGATVPDGFGGRQLVAPGNYGAPSYVEVTTPGQRAADAAAAARAAQPDDDSFAGNSAHDPHAGQAGYVQAEDGSWVPTSFYGR